MVTPPRFRHTRRAQEARSEPSDQAPSIEKEECLSRVNAVTPSTCHECERGSEIQYDLADDVSLVQLGEEVAILIQRSGSLNARPQRA